MQFREFVEHFAEVTGRTYTDSKLICEDVLNVIMDTLLNNKSIEIYGFGRIFTHVIMPKRIVGIDGNEHISKPKRTIRFRTGKAFERRLNEGV